MPGKRNSVSGVFQRFYKSLTVFFCALLVNGHAVFLYAQLPAPLPKLAAPVASPTAIPSPVSKPVEPTAPPEKTPAPTVRSLVDGLSQSDLNDALKLLKSNYLNPAALDDLALSRATLQGLIERLAPGVSILDKPPGNKETSPFRAEILDDRIGYLRLGSLAKGNIGEMDAALQNFKDKALKSAVLDLRATPESSDFDSAAEVIKRFCPKGKLLFTVKKISAKQERIVTSNREPLFQGLLVVLAGKETAGAPEVIAAALGMHAGAMVVGQETAGAPVEFADLPLHDGKLLRVAVAEAVLPGNVSIFPKGVKPDIAVGMPEETKREVMRLSLEKGVSQFVFETERPHMNEAALVAGSNPELDALEASQRLKVGERPNKTPPHDVVLQRAVDLVTSIGIFHGKPPAGEK